MKALFCLNKGAVLYEYNFLRGCLGKGPRGQEPIARHQGLPEQQHDGSIGDKRLFSPGDSPLLPFTHLTTSSYTLFRRKGHLRALQPAPLFPRRETAQSRAMSWTRAAQNADRDSIFSSTLNCP